MGRMSLEGMRAMLKEEAALEWHLRSNHYPPVPLCMKPVAKAAIEAARNGNFDEKVDLPEGVTWKDGSVSVPAGRIIESLHLDSFLSGEDE